MFFRILLSVLLISVFTISVANAKMDFENAVAIWLFDDGAGDEIEDISGNDNHGTIQGDSTWVDGKFGGALEFDGVSTVIDCGVGESIDFVGQQNFSISVWANSNTDSIVDGMFVYKSLGCSTWAQYGFGVGAIEANSAAPNKLNFYYRMGNAGDEEVVIDEGDFPADEWVHAVGTYDGEALKIYINGELVADEESDGIPWASTEHVWIGGDPGCGVRYIWSGLLDEIMIFNKTLSEAEINDLMKGFEQAGAVSPGGKLATTWSDIRSH